MLRKQKAGGGRGGGRGGGGRGGRGASLLWPTMHPSPWPKHYKALYYYAAKKLATHTCTVPYIVDVNAAPVLSKYSSSSLVWARTTGGEQMAARTLFAAMPRVGEPAYDADREMLDIIHDRGEGGGGDYDEVQVEDSDPT